MNDYKQRILDELLELVPVEAPASARRPLPRQRIAVLAGLGAILTGVVILTVAPRPGGRNVVAAAAAAVDQPAGSVLHYRLIGHRIVSDYIEVWQTTDPKGRLLVRTIAQRTRGDGGRCLMESSLILGADKRTVVQTSWNPNTRTAHRGPGRHLAPGDIAFPDAFAEISRHLRRGALIPAGRTTVDGRQAIRLVPKAPERLPREGRFGDLTQKFEYLVDASNYRPLRWVVWDGQYYDVQTFEYLPASTANLALTSAPAAHPGAPVLNGNPSAGSVDCGAG